MLGESHNYFLPTITHSRLLSDIACIKSVRRTCLSVVGLSVCHINHYLLRPSGQIGSHIVQNWIA